MIFGIFGTFGADVTLGTLVTFGTVTLITLFYTLDIIPGKFHTFGAVWRM